ncbi:MAG TPA: DUF2628 domain-containing protein, partial [Chthonomonadaceae bacterium]|nr:DUF2628 domain-containing protein [Chthonomonadaceae bacterium]
SAGAIPVNPPRAGAPAPTGSVPPSPTPGVPPLQAPNYAPPPAAPLSAPAPLYTPPSGPQSLTGEPLPPPVAPAPMQCRVCGTVLTPRDYSCPRCNTPVGMVANPNDPTAASYVPTGYAPIIENTSGQKGSVPPELQGGWNWGASFLTLFWCISHRVWWPLLVGLGSVGVWIILIAVVMAAAMSSPGSPPTYILILPVGYLIIWIINLVLFILLGIRGNSLAWQHRRFDSVEHCRTVQRIWAKWVLGLFLAAVAFWFAMFMLTIVAGVASAPR